MIFGVPDTGPYGQIRSLRREIDACKYQLALIAQGVKTYGSKRLNGIIATNRAKIKQIKDSEK